MNKSKDIVSTGYEGKSVEELKITMAQLAQQEKFEEAQKVLTEIQNQEKANKPTDEIKKFGEEYGEKSKEIKKLQKEIKTLEAKKKKTAAESKEISEKKEEERKLLKNFFTKDIKNYQGKIEGNMKEINDAKDKKIEDLESQLNDTITTLPTLGEYFSLERRRLVSIHTKFQEYKKDTNNYPKNFLIYAMGMANHTLLGGNEAIKRTRVKLARRRKSDDIKKNMEILENKLNITDNDKTPRKRSIKLLITKEIQEAKVAQLQKNKESLGLAA